MPKTGIGSRVWGLPSAAIEETGNWPRDCRAEPHQTPSPVQLSSPRENLVQEIFFFSFLLGQPQLQPSETAWAKPTLACVFMFGFSSVTHCGLEVVRPIRRTPRREEKQVTGEAPSRNSPWGFGTCDRTGSFGTTLRDHIKKNVFVAKYTQIQQIKFAV